MAVVHERQSRDAARAFRQQPAPGAAPVPYGQSAPVVMPAVAAPAVVPVAAPVVAAPAPVPVEPPKATGFAPPA